MQETFQVLKRFFALDLETKMDAHSIKNPAIRGYEPMFWTKLDGRTKGGKFSLFLIYVAERWSLPYRVSVAHVLIGISKETTKI